MDREALLRHLTILDFMALDLHLYLNTHPEDSEALEMYNDCVTRSAQVRQQFEENFGPLTAFRSVAQEDWPWNNCPWPWQESFNFSFAGEQSNTEPMVESDTLNM